MDKQKLALILILSFFLQGFPFFSKPPVTAQLSKTTVATGEMFSYTVTVTGTFDDPLLQLPNFKHLEIISQSQSKEYVKTGTKKVMKTAITIFLRSRTPRVVKIGSSLLSDGKRRYKTKGLVVKIIGSPLTKEKNLESYIQGGKNL